MSYRPSNPFAALEFITGRPLANNPGQHKHSAPEANKGLDFNKLTDSGANANKQNGAPSDPLISAWLGGQPEEFDDDETPRAHRTERKNVSKRENGSPERPKLRPRREELEELRRERRKNRKREPSPTAELKPGHSPNNEATTTIGLGGSPVKSDGESPSNNGLLRRRGAKHERQASRRKRSPSPTSSSPHAPPNPPSTIWSGNASIHPDDSASVAAPRGYESHEQLPIAPLKITKSAKVARSPPQAATKTNADMTSYGPTRPTEDNNKSMQLTRPRPQRHVTTDEDLMSVLSMPDGAGAPLKSACSLRSRKSPKVNGDTQGLLDDLKDEETKYGRELKTLIDGVIPVLLTTAMSKEKAKTVSNLMAGPNSNVKATTPIVNMGVALERLRSVHRRMPYATLEALVNWGEQAERVYADYIQAWRMGFQDVVVNLAPGEGTSKSDDGLKRDAEGFVITDEGRKVDVAFLLKRPLVRVKNLSKTFKTIGQLVNTRASQLRVDKYQQLVEQARQRQNEERARLEDEAASSIDSTRARDPKTLAPLPGVQIDPSRCVRARDTFDLNFLHSTGQRIDCRVELIIRDDRPNHGSSGDILICELQEPAKWLLLPPVQLDKISSRIDAVSGDLIVMVRGPAAVDSPWQEVFKLHPEDDESGWEWLNMLGTQPVPPALQSFNTFAALPDAAMFAAADEAKSSRTTGRRKVSPTEIEVPLGEQASVISRHFGTRPSASEIEGATPERAHHTSESAGSTPLSSVASALSTTSQARPLPQAPPTGYRPRRDDSPFAGATGPPRDLNDAMSKAGSDVSEPDRPRRSDYSAVNALRHPEAARRHTGHRQRPPSPSASTNYSVWMPPPASSTGEVNDPFVNDVSDRKAAHRRDTSASVYKSSMPDFSKKRREHEGSQSPTNLEDIMSNLMMSGGRDAGASMPPSPTETLRKDIPSQPSRSAPNTPARYAHQRSRPSYHPSEPPVSVAGSDTPSLTPPSLTHSPVSRPFSGHRRSSSPLKHEWDPSSASEASLTANILEDSEWPSDAESLSSQSSVEDVVPSLPSMTGMHSKRNSPTKTHFESKNTSTLAPSNSASQVSPGGSPGTVGPSQRIATLFAWSDKGAWQPLIADECAIVVSPGLIEAFNLTALNSALAQKPHNPSQPPSSFNPGTSPNPPRPSNLAPLLALELTPLVPLRRGTALDISIRSPATAASALDNAKNTNQFLLRSRTNTECDALYAAINHARIHNPTYIALQNAHPPPKKSSWAAVMDARPDASQAGGSKRLFRIGRKSSYRAKSRRTPSIAANTDQTTSSVAELVGDALGSALKRLANPGSKAFSLAKSSIDHSNSRDSATFSSSSGAPASGTSTPPAGMGSGPADLNAGIDPAMGTPLGIRNLKIRLYERQQMNNTWRDRGSARLTVLQPPRPPGAPPPLAPDGRLVTSKRIVILGKTKGEVLLDVTLGENAFERVGRVGIALNVWEQREGVESKGSVMSGRKRMYMVQCKAEAEAGFMFGLVGRAVRY